MAHKFSTSYLEDSIALFRFYKKMSEGAIEQVTDEQLFDTLDEEMNSIAIIVKHMSGNMRSRWTNFLSSDGEKPDRNRDTEFVDPATTRADLMRTLARLRETRGLSVVMITHDLQLTGSLFDRVVALSAIDERPNDIEQTPLIAITRNRAAQ